MTTTRKTRVSAFIFFFLAICLATVVVETCTAASPEQAVARKMLDAADVRGGLVVHLGCGDGKVTAALCANDSYVVHGLDANANNIVMARKHIRSLDRCGRVSVEQWSGDCLPYAGDLVNLVVASGECPVASDEITRVLAPGGVALFLNRKSEIENRKLAKPWPNDIDEWTHFLRDASNNAVAQDTRVGPPRRLRWKCGPLWSRSHEFVSSVAAMVAGGGRMFYVVDEGLTSLTDERLPERWMLIGRDAFNGVQLWKRPLPDWRGDEWKNTSLRGRPPSSPRRIVADGQQLYATLSHRGSLEVLDPATGKTLETIDGTANTQEILLSDRTLVLRLAPLGARRGESHGSIVAIDAGTRRERWRVSANQYLSQSLATAGGRVVFNTGAETVCLALNDGQELWRQRTAKGKRSGEKTFILYGDLVLVGDGSGVTALSAKTGETLWAAACRGGSMRPHDLFVARGCAWHAHKDGIAGFNLKTGELIKTIDPSCVQSAGHHLRCYRAKATEQYLITQFRGAEFISLTDDNHVNNDWIRGPCRYGIMPSNGLLYVPPNPCFCYPTVKLTGLLALAPAGKAEPDATNRLERGPVYGEMENQKSKIEDSAAWPTYRHDARRSAATACDVPAQVSRRWIISLPGPLTPPVSCGDRVYVAAKDTHTVHALAIDDGRELWRFTAGGRIDSPPTIYGGLLLFGCADGRVYCLRVSDGELAWRFRAAPSDQRIVAFSQLESPWRVHGSVLLEGGIAYCTAGRSTFLDGGIWIFGLDPQTGEILHQAHLDTWSPTRDDAVDKPFMPSYHIEGTHSDILVGEGERIYLGQYAFDRKLAKLDAPYVMPDPDNPVVAMDISKEGYIADDPDLKKGYEYYRSFHRYMERAHPELSKRYKEKYGGLSMGDRNTGMHLSPTAGFLDDTWFNRTYWMFSANWPGWYHAHRGAKSGQMLVIGPERTYALQAFPTRNRQSPLFTPGDKGYLLLADDNDTEPVLDDMTRGATKGMGYTRLKPPVWYDWVPIRIRGMVLAGRSLFVAGPPDAVAPDDPMAAFEGRQGAIVRAYSAADGKHLAECQLDAPPVFDGLIAASGRLFMSTIDGHVVCFGEK